MKRNTILVVVVAIVALLIFFNPLRYLRGRPGQPRRPEVPAATLSRLTGWVESRFMTPDEYVLSCFRSHDIVFLGELSKISQNVTLVSALIPRLYAAGVRTLAIEYALADDQPRIDALLTAPAYDEAEARRITFRWLVTWGFQEYVDLYRAAWEVNRKRPAGSPAFRIVALNVRQNWELVKTEADMTDPKTVKAIIANGVPDEYMAGVIRRQVISRGEKALVYCRTQSAFTRFREREYETNIAARGISETRRTGNIIRDAAGDRCFSIQLHAPWPDRSQSGLCRAADASLDALIDALPPEKRHAGFDTAGSPFAALPIKSGRWAQSQPGLTLADLCDGYIVQGSLAQYVMVRQIPGFVSEADAAYAARNFPGPKPQGITAAQVNQAITEDLKAVAEALASLK